MPAECAYGAIGSQISSATSSTSSGPVSSGSSGGPHFADAYAHHVVKLSVAGMVAHLQYRSDDLPPSGGVCPPVTVDFQHDCRAVVRSITPRISGQNGPSSVLRIGKFAPRSRPLIPPLQEPSAK